MEVFIGLLGKSLMAIGGLGFIKAMFFNKDKVSDEVATDISYQKLVVRRPRPRR